MATVTNYYTATFTPSVSGSVNRSGVNQTFSNIRSGAGTSSSTSVLQVVLASSSTTNQFSELDRIIAAFDTSSLPDTAVITSASIVLSCSGKNNYLGSPAVDIVSSSPASTASLTSSDYTTLGTTSFSQLSYASIPSSGNVSFSLDSNGIANISLTGYSTFGMRSSWDTGNSFSGTWNYDGFSATAFSFTSISLVVNYSVDYPTVALTGVSSITGLSSITAS